jgi:hypothetical protein
MTLKNRTSSKHRKPAVYVDQSQLQKDNHQAQVNASRARSFAAIRGAKIAPAAALAKKQANEAKEQEDAAAATAAADAANEAAAMETEDGHEGEEESKSVAASTITRGLDGFTVAFTPFRSTDSSAVAVTTDSALKDDRVLGVALWEWLLTKLDWDCHTLWEKFLSDWDLITETERPPGTNRPVNLHSYLTYLKSVNNKRIVRKDIRDVRETLRVEREAAVESNPEDVYARPNLAALNGSLLQYYLKIKNLIPYESEAASKRKKEQVERKRKAEEEGQGEEAKEDATPSTSNRPIADEIVERQPKKKKQKHSAKAPPPEARAAGLTVRDGPTVAPGSNRFAGLLDCE